MTPTTGRKLIIVGAGETAEIAYEYFTHDSPHTVAAFAVEEAYLKERERYRLPVITLERLVEHYPPDQFGAHVAALGMPALSATALHTVGYLATMAIVAVVVYERLGLRMLRSLWINVDAVWAVGLLVTAGVVLAR